VIAIVVSRADSASEHIGEWVLELEPWTESVDDERPEAQGGGTVYRSDGFELRTVEELHLHLDGVAGAFDDPDLLLFASRHSGETGPLLTAHFTGNFGPAEFGGDDRSLARACPGALDRVLTGLEEHAPEGYEVGAECTHHGPSQVGAPSMFVEVGSERPQWEDPAAARAVARAILGLRDADPDADRTVVGFGGGHYVPRFARILRETPWAVGHVGADWALEAMGDPEENREVLAQAFERSDATRAVIDGERPALEAVLEDLGYRTVSETWVREVGSRPPELVEAVETCLGDVDEGVRFGSVVPEDPGAVVVREFPSELLSEAQGIDAGAAMDAVTDNAVAFETTEGATRATGSAAVVDGEAMDRLVEDLAAVLRSSYDEVTLEDEAVTATETAFDPSLARDLGVPEGPAFGELSAGQSVEVDGETVDPEAVHVERTRRFDLER
jgi:D-aminoacyl-tRNA deacylase